MQLITDIAHFHPSKESVLTIGTFDGIHVGHQRIIAQVVATAKAQGLTPTLLTFFPHPRMVLDPSSPIALIQTIEERAQLLESYGIEQLVIQPFNKEFAALSAQDYVQNLLVEKLRARVVIIGYDHRFGKGRAAGIEELKAFGTQYHFQVEEIPVQEVDSCSVSSIKIRRTHRRGYTDGYPLPWLSFFLGRQGGTWSKIRTYLGLSYGQPTGGESVQNRS